MLVTDKLIFLQLHKTGSTHIAKLLKNILGGEQIGKHNRIPVRLNDGKRKIIASIRNPWDWYISLWAYGCDKRGALFERLVSPRALRGHNIRKNIKHGFLSILNEFSRTRKKYQSTYLSVTEAKLFRKWLFMIHDANNKYDIGEGYGGTEISRHAGLLTYRYMMLFCKNINSIPDTSINSTKSIGEFIQKNILINFWIKNENLENDLIEAIKLSGHVLNEEQIMQIKFAKKTNTSNRNRRISYYYDVETMDLVKKRERVIIDMHDYNHECDQNETMFI